MKSVIGSLEEGDCVLIEGVVSNVQRPNGYRNIAVMVYGNEVWVPEQVEVRVTERPLKIGDRVRPKEGDDIEGRVFGIDESMLAIRWDDEDLTLSHSGDVERVRWSR